MFGQRPCLGGVPKLQPSNRRAGLVRRKGSVERAPRVRVEIVADENHLLGGRVAGPQEFLHLDGPVDLRALFPNADVTPAGEGFRERKNAGGSGPLVFVIDASGGITQSGILRFVRPFF